MLNKLIILCACGCYFGIASCKTANLARPAKLDNTSWNEVDPNSKINFSFTQFSKLFPYFKQHKIECSALETIFNKTSAQYKSAVGMVSVKNDEYSEIVKEYSKLIENLSFSEKTDLNVFIKSLDKS